MSEEIFRYIRENSPIKIYEPGELIFNQGDNADVFYYLESGLSLTYKALEDGRERNILVTWPGHLFGFTTFFEQKPHRASAIAIERCKVCIITRQGYETCLERFPSFKDFIISDISTDMGVLFDELTDFSLVNADIRVARFICRRVDEGNVSGSPARPELPFTQSFIANVLGISRLSVNKALTHFSANGWLTTGYGRITILNMAEIRNYADEENT